MKEALSLYKKLLRASQPFKPKIKFNIKEAFQFRRNTTDEVAIKNFIQDARKTHDFLIKLNQLPPDVFKELFLKLPSNKHYYVDDDQKQ